MTIENQRSILDHHHHSAGIQEQVLAGITIHTNHTVEKPNLMKEDEVDHDQVQILVHIAAVHHEGEEEVVVGILAEVDDLNFVRLLYI